MSNYGVELLNDKSAVISEEVMSDPPQHRSAEPGSFEESLLQLICEDKEPTDQKPFTTAKQAEDTMHMANGLLQLFGN
jgi:hypothetical protein